MEVQASFDQKQQCTVSPSSYRACWASRGVCSYVDAFGDGHQEPETSITPGVAKSSGAYIFIPEMLSNRGLNHRGKLDSLGNKSSILSDLDSEGLYYSVIAGLGDDGGFVVQ